MTASRDPTVVAELTPPGRAAVAVVVVAGPNSLNAVRRFYSPATPWRENGPTIDRIMLGRWGREQGEELVVCRRGDDEFEIHCHGGAAAATAIVEQLVREGCERLSWREWLLVCQRNTSVLGKSESRRDSATCGRVSPTRGFEPACATAPSDSTTCSAITALAGATTVRTAGVLLDQYHGALSRAVEAARDAVAGGDAVLARQVIDGILAFRDLGLHLTTPWRVVIAGPPNVGKSSLINAIAGYQRAIVSPLPGTTRDVVTITTAIGGWPVQIADTAGLRATQDELESAGVALAGAALQRADLVIAVSDARAEIHDATETLCRLAPTGRVIHAVNKIDLVDRDAALGKLGRAAASPRRVPSNPAGFALQVFVSALTGQGLPELLVAMERVLVPAAPSPGAAVAFTRSQIVALETARTAIDRADIRAADAALASVLAGDSHAEVARLQDG